MKLTVVVTNRLSALCYANYVSALAGVPMCKLPSSSFSKYTINLQQNYCTEQCILGVRMRMMYITEK